MCMNNFVKEIMKNITAAKCTPNLVTGIVHLPDKMFPVKMKLKRFWTF